SADGLLPARLEGGSLTAIDYRLPTPSAQIKSAVILAALGAAGETVIREPAPSRDHTERMLPAFGGHIVIEEDGEGRVLRVRGGQRLRGAAIEVPGDPSSAAFLVAAALIVEGSDVLIRNVLLNPRRAGFFEVAREMGGDIASENERTIGGEPVADLRVRASRLKGVAVPASRAASMIDEYPALAALAAFADGDTYMVGVEELRVKESDRIAAMEAGLKACGVDVESGGDWFRVFGRAGEVPGGARIATQDDHRIAMSFLTLGFAASAPVEIDDASMIATSFPTYEKIVADLGATIEAA
ncbi:MAG: 3-phosphoshikimate 1-carboxyvinyltransferase, partial [Pseudomonadota bacterium]